MKVNKELQYIKGTSLGTTCDVKESKIVQSIAAVIIMMVIPNKIAIITDQK